MSVIKPPDYAPPTKRVDPQNDNLHVRRNDRLAAASLKAKREELKKKPEEKPAQETEND